jgi:hypothetical protein
MLIFHYTDRDGFNSIRAAIDWRFKAHQPPPGDTNPPRACYFTTRGPETKNLSQKLRVPKRKLEYVFVFEEAGDLTPLRGNRGEWILYFAEDYVVRRDRQRYHGPSKGYTDWLRERGGAKP